MKIFNSIRETIGNTPIVRVSKNDQLCKANIYAKLEFMNPGGSIKDRLVQYLLLKMENEGRINSNTTIVENSSGNTGAAWSMMCASCGIKCIITMPDKMSDEKIFRMKSYGTQVLIAPTSVAADSPHSYYSLAKNISQKTPDSIYPDQYNNPLNAEAHYKLTAPEIWEQTEGNIDVFVCGIGTGGTISGIGRFLKEKNPEIKIIGVDPIGSIFYDYFYYDKIPESNQYYVEGIGEDYLVKAVDFSVIDEIVRVSDSDSFRAARKLIREEGIFCGGSSGSALYAALKVSDEYKDKNILVLFPDSGNMYLSKFLNDDWMINNGFEL